MHEFYFSKKSLNYKEYLIEQQIYDDIYQYKSTDNITIKMLSTIVLNKNQTLFNSILPNRKLTNEEKIVLLKLIADEGEEYINFSIELFKDIKIDKEDLLVLIQKAMISNNFKILDILLNIKTNTDLDISIIFESLSKNPNLMLLKYLTNKYNHTTILNEKFLIEIIDNDYLDLFIYYISHNKNYNHNYLLNIAIKKNAYTIIHYLLNQIEVYQNIEEENYYNDFFDFLMFENFEKVILFLDKCHNILKLGNHNLEKLLFSFENHLDFKKLLFEYHLINIEIKDKILQEKIEKFILEKKLQDKLSITNKKKEVKKI